MRLILHMHAGLPAGRFERSCIVMQVKARPPTFAVFTTAASISDRAQKLLMNSIRRDFGFQGVPIRLIVRRKLRTKRSA